MEAPLANGKNALPDRPDHVEDWVELSDKEDCDAYDAE
jgi:hypothetical protein